MKVLEPIEIPIKLQVTGIQKDLETVKKQIAAASDSAEVVKLKDLYSDVERELKKVNTQLEYVEGATFEDIAASTLTLDKKFKALNDKMSLTPKTLNGLNAQLEAYSAIALQAGKNDPIREQALTQVGKLRNEYNELNKEIETFVTAERGFKGVGDSLGGITTSLLSLDFETAGEKAQGLQKIVNSISAEDVDKQIKGLTTTMTTLTNVGGQAIIGLVKNIGTLAKGFLTMGKALLTNPIFLIAAAFIAIAGVIALLLNKLGLLKPILDTIGEVFGWIGDVIDAVVQSIKDMLDWLGLTDYAAEDSAAKQSAAMEKKANAYEKTSKKIQFYLDEEIKLAKIAGKDTTELEIKKQESIRETAKVRLEALRAKLAENNLTKAMDAEELKALYEKINAQKELIKVSSSEIKIIKAQEAADRTKEANEAKAEAQGNAKEAAANAKKYREERLAAERQIKDLELSSLKEGYDKEVALNAEKYRRLIEDTKKNESLIASEKKAIIKAYELEKVEQDKALFKAKQAESQKENDELIVALETVKQSKLEALRRELEAAKDLKVLMMEEGLLKETEELALKRERDLADKELTESEIKIIEENYRRDKAEAEETARQKKKELDKASQDASFAIVEGGLGAIAGISDLAFEIKKGNLEKGSKAEEAAARKNFETNKKVQIAIAVISGIQGVINALTAQSVIPEPFGMILKAVNAVTVGVTTAVNIAKIKNTKFGSSSGGASTGGSAPTASSVSAAIPTPNLYGNSNNLNNLNGAKSVESKPTHPPQITVKAVVAADEMTAEQMVERNIMANAGI